MTVCGGLVHETLALQNAETMLFVDGNEAESREFHVVFNQGVRTDDEFCFARTNALERSEFFGMLQATDEQFDVVSAGGENATRGEIMLYGENFRGSHERGLAAVFNGDSGRL